MATYSSPEAYGKALQAAMDKGFSDFIQETQSLLTQRAPIDTGRLASSFYISKSRSSKNVRPADWAPPGANKQVLPKYPRKVTFDGTWFITNNVPYAVRVAKNPTYGKNGRGFGSEWYNATVNLNQTRMNAALTAAIRSL
tara:strand:- start:379 stop:798 length:420 start_codon:yes stop_codon:yes gene_type:complete